MTFGRNTFAWLVLLFFLGTPIILTIINIVFLFYKKDREKLSKITDVLTFVLGISFSVLLFSIYDFPEWDKSIVLALFVINLHTPVSFKFMPSFFTLCAIALVGYIILRIKKDKLPPLTAALCISGNIIGIALSIAWCIQISKNIDKSLVIMFLLFPINYILCSIRLLRDVLTLYAKKACEIEYENKFLNFCNGILKRAPGLLLFSFVLTVPVLCFVAVILLLFGQTPDGFIKMFTNTADWTLSQQIPPPPVEYHGHYLCTVAACGDEKVVKPIRIGIRQNAKIIVNRQLCVANAFEDLIKEKMPRFHRAIRYIYDKYGYPLSKHITTKKRANAVYIMMKPLEWLFLIALYTFDQKPENRIAMQYTGVKNENI